MALHEWGYNDYSRAGYYNLFRAIILEVITSRRKKTMQPSYKTPEMDAGIKEVFGIDRKAIIKSNHCSFCDSPDLDFRDALSRKEYSISGICQTCQDKVFGGNEYSINGE